MKKLFFIILAWAIGFYGLSFAFNEFSYGNAKSLANDYILNSSFDENWKWTNPHIDWEWKYFYTDSENPSYVEFKVSCDKTKDCWFIMVNFDWDDVSVPIASTSWNTPSEVLSAKNWSNIKNNKLYYFNPFEQYAENEVTWDISSIDPQDDFWDDISWSGNITPEVKKEKKVKKNKALKDKIVKARSEAKDYKRSDDFKKKRKDLKDKKQTNWKDEVSFKYLDIALAEDSYISSQYYNKPNYTSNTFVAWQWFSNIQCTWLLPCYRQFSETFQIKDCLSWCSPNALAMIYWYYDRNGKSNLIPWTTAWIVNDESIKSMVRTIRTQMETKCNTWVIYNGKAAWATYLYNIKKAVQYAKDKWYIYSTSVEQTWSTLNMFQTIKTEINSSRPVVWSTKTHTFAIFWYSNDNYNSKVVRINIWWWNTSFKDTNNNIYYGSNIDYNIDNFFYNGVSQWALLSISTFNIK